jgi:hypothetical protein
MMAVAVAVTAIVVGSGLSAVLTGGRSVNPLDGIQQVVTELRDGRTADQTSALRAADKAVDLATEHARAGRDDKARDELERARKLLDDLALKDRDEMRQRIVDVERALKR